MSLSLVDEFNVFFQIVFYFVWSFLARMSFKYSCIDSRIDSSNYRINILYCVVHHILIFLHLIPINYRRVSFSSYSMHMYAPSMLPFVSVPIIFQVPLWYQHIFEKNIKAFIEKPSCYMWIFYDVPLLSFG